MVSQPGEQLTPKYAAVLEKAKIWNLEDCHSFGMKEGGSCKRALDAAAVRLIFNGQSSGTPPRVLLRRLSILRTEPMTDISAGPVEPEIHYGLMAGVPKK